MKKVLFAIIILLAFCMSSYGSRLVEGSLDNLFFATTVDGSMYGRGIFKDIKTKDYSDGVIIKYNKEFEVLKIVTSGCKYAINFNDVATDEWGNIFVVGTVYENSYGEGILKGLKPKGKSDIIVAKYDNNLNLIDIVNYGAKNNNSGEKIIVCKNGNIAICGRQSVDDNITFGVIAKFDNNLKFIDSFDFVGSFKSNYDAEWTEISNLKERENGEIIGIGSTANTFATDDGVKKAFVVVTNPDLTLKSKMSFGGKDNEIYLYDIIEKPQGGYVTIGHKRGEKVKGLVMELDKDLKKISYKEYAPTYKGETANAVILNELRPFTGNDGGWTINGSAYYDRYDTVNFYVIYNDDGFSEMVCMPERTGMNVLITPNNNFYIIGYDENFYFKGEEIGWF